MSENLWLWILGGLTGFYLLGLTVLAIYVKNIEINFKEDIDDMGDQIKVQGRDVQSVAVKTAEKYATKGDLNLLERRITLNFGTQFTAIQDQLSAITSLLMGNHKGKH